MSELAKTTNNKETGKTSLEVVNLHKKLHEVIKKDERLSQKNSVGYVVLTCVLQGHYKRALKELELMPVGLEEYKDFESRSRRFIEHAQSLVNAIRIKYEVCLSENISKITQKELADNIYVHFLDLRKSIIAIEKVQKSVRAEDMSSTKLFLRTFFFSLVIIFAVYACVYLVTDLKDLSHSKLFQYFQWSFPQ